MRGDFVHISDLPRKFIHQIYFKPELFVSTEYYLAMPLTLKVPVFLGSFFRKFCLAVKFVSVFRFAVSPLHIASSTG